MKNRKWRKVALALSACLFLLWWVLGTSATLAWFSDVDTVRNEFRFGLLDLDVYYKNSTSMQYTQMQPTSTVFNDNALYEPGYTQVVYLKIDNVGDVDFKYKVAVTVVGSTPGTSILGNKIYLPDYLRYGVVFAETEEALLQQVESRLNAKHYATNEWGAVGTWSLVSPYTFEVEKKVEDPEYAHYAALIIRMPEEVGNVANHIAGYQPSVELGVTVFAQQANAPLD